uniref:Uncharacterized protein n=1 Tax=viral metagenome TaxID=1070528 RepID=A0A6C0B2W2_9ZZZZ
MDAHAGPRFPLGLGVLPPPGAEAAVAAAAPAAAPTPFTDAIMDAVNGGIVNTSAGYELPYPVYIASLEPSLKHHYPEPEVRPRAPPAPAPAPAPAPGAVGNSVGYVRTLYDFVRIHRPNPRNIWTNQKIRTLFDNARTFVDSPPPGRALVYNAAAPAPYKAAIQAYVNDAGNQLAAGIPGANVMIPLNIGP